MVDMEAIRVGHFLVFSVREQSSDFSDLVHLFVSSACRPMCVLHWHEDKNQR